MSKLLKHLAVYHDNFTDKTNGWFVTCVMYVLQYTICKRNIASSNNELNSLLLCFINISEEKTNRTKELHYSYLIFYLVNIECSGKNICVFKCFKINLN